MSEGKRRSFIEVLFHGDPFERFVVAIITSVAVLAAVVTLLQTDASARAGQAGRDAQRYAIQAMGRRITGYVTVDYAWYAYQVNEELDTEALMAERADDAAAAARYRALRSRLSELTPFLAPPYYDPNGNAGPDLQHYEADTYLVAATGLAERYAAAAALNNAWTAKSNAYVTHLTLLAVSLFLFGLATTVPGWIRWLFVVVGLFITAMVVLWIGWVTVRPLPVLTERAIDAYAEGVGLAHRRDLEGAVAAYDRALAEAPHYANAYYERANTRYDLADYEGAIADYRAAQVAGRDDVNVAWNLGWTYYLLGRFDEAIAASRHAVDLSPDQVGVRFNVALAYLAAGQIERAQIEYTDAMDVATRQVAGVAEGGDKPPASLWTYMDAAVRDLEGLIAQLRGEPRAWTEAPPPDKVADPETVVAAAVEISRQLKSLTVALEYTGRPPGVTVTAKVSPLEFAKPTYDSDGNLLGRTIATAFPYGTDRVLALFDYDGMQDGQEVLWKLYFNGYEDPAWRLVEVWSLGKSGSAEKPFSLSYTNLYQFTPGEYKIELYVDNQFVQEGVFEIEADEAP